MSHFSKLEMTRKTKTYYAISAFLLISVTAFFFLSPGRFIRHPKENGLHSSTQHKTKQDDTTIISLAFVGDIMGHEPQINAAYKSDIKDHDYTNCFIHLKSYLEEIDFSLANLEVTLAGPPYSGYPQFSSPDALARDVFKSGFDFLVTANNHSQDRGKYGLERTIHVLDSLNIPHTGTFKDTLERESAYPYILTIKGIRIAILNYTYGTNGLIVEHPNVVNMIDTAVMRKDLIKAKKQNPDFIITTLHWGLEYKRTESTEQQKIAQFLADHGTDVIVGSHPHVVQPIKYIYTPDSLKKVPVIYSLGNFISNQRAQYKDGGIMVEFKLRKYKNKTEWFDLNYMPVWVHKKEYPTSYTLIPAMLWEKDSAKFGLNSKEIIAFKTFVKDTRTHLKDIQENQFYK